MKPRLEQWSEATNTMADYGRGNAANGRSTMGARFQSWEIANNRAESTDGWNRSGFLSKADARDDHVCRPVVVGADGRVMPGVLEYLQDPRRNGFVAKTETVEDKAYRFQPTSAYTAYTGDRFGGLDKRGTPKVQEFLNNVQNAAGNGTSMGFPGSMFQRAKANHNTSTYGGYEGTNDMMAPEPALITDGGWARPSRTGWGLPPTEPLGKVTNDISGAADYLRESARPPSVTAYGADRWSSAASSPAYQTWKKEPAAGRAIDSREAAKKYGGQFIW